MEGGNASKIIFGVFWKNLKIFQKRLDKSKHKEYNLRVVKATHNLCTISSVGRAPDS